MIFNYRLVIFEYGIKYRIRLNGSTTLVKTLKIDQLQHICKLYLNLVKVIVNMGAYIVCIDRIITKYGYYYNNMCLCLSNFLTKYVI